SFSLFSPPATSALYTLSLHDALPICDFGERRGNDPALEGLVDGGAGVSGIADIGGPIEDVAEDVVFVRGSGPRIIGNFLFQVRQDRKSTRLNSSHVAISYAVFCLKKK